MDVAVNEWRDDESAAGGNKTGPNPPDRGEGGVKRHMLTDGQGMPLALAIDGASRHNVKLVRKTPGRYALEPRAADGKMSPAFGFG